MLYCKISTNNIINKTKGSHENRLAYDCPGNVINLTSTKQCQYQNTFSKYILIDWLIDQDLIFKSFNHNFHQLRSWQVCLACLAPVNGGQCTFQTHFILIIIFENLGERHNKDLWDLWCLRYMVGDILQLEIILNYRRIMAKLTRAWSLETLQKCSLYARALTSLV